MKVAINEILMRDNNRNYDVLDFEVFKDLKEISKSNTFFFSTINDCSYLQTSMYGSTSLYDISVDKYLAFLNDKFVNFNGYFKQVCQLNESDLNKFCRSNSSYKQWSGQILKDNIDLNFIKNNLQQDILLYLAPVKYISNEMRLWMIDGKCVEITEYPTWTCDGLEYTYPKFKFTKEDYIKYAEDIAEDWEPDDMYVMDIGISYGNLCLIEYNPFSSCGFYNADISKIVKAVKEKYTK